MNTAPISPAEDLVARAVTISSPPLIYEKLMQVINDHRTGAVDIARVIVQDQGLTARVLMVVNSAFYGLPIRVDTVTTAVRLIGMSQIRDLAVTTSVIALFDDVPGDLLDPMAFWHHSLGCGVTARVLAGYRREDNVERFLVTGVLHDVGKLVMLMSAPEKARVALEAAKETGRSLSECEREHLGCTHAQVGAALMERWDFPSALREAVEYHHQPARARRFPIEAAAVHLGDIVSNALGWGHGGQSRTPRLDEVAWDSLGLDAALVPFMIDDAERQLDEAVQLIAGRSS